MDKRPGLPLFISKYMVMKSAAGYYIGRYCYEHDCGPGSDKNNWYLQPYDRDSGYSTEPFAENLLKLYTEEFGSETIKEFEARFTLYIKKK